MKNTFSPKQLNVICFALSESISLLETEKLDKDDKELMKQLEKTFNKASTLMMKN